MSDQPISDVAIANRALQKLGASRIDALDQDTPNARSVNAAYYIIRNRLLRKHTWNFAKKRASIAADATETVYGGLNRFQKPNDFLRLLRDTEAGTGNQNGRQNWQIEGNYIVTDNPAPLEFRYIAKVTDPAQFDALFVEYFAAVLAYELCEEITQSSTKKDGLASDIRQIVDEAKQTNAIENDADLPPEDDWILVRL